MYLFDTIISKISIFSTKFNFHHYALLFYKFLYAIVISSKASLLSLYITKDNPIRHIAISELIEEFQMTETEAAAFIKKHWK